MAKKQSRLTPTQRKIVTGVSIAVEVAMIAVCIVFSVFIILGAQKESGQLNDGINLVTVQSDSMNGTQKDSFKTGDLLIVRRLDMSDEKDIAQVKVGSIVTYYGIIKGEENGQAVTKTEYISHRVVEEPIVENQSVYFVVQGDVEAEQGKDTKMRILSTEIKGLVVGNLGGVGKAIDFLKKPEAFFPLIVVPLVLLLIYNGFVGIKALMDAKVMKLEKEKDKAVELATQAAVAEALRQLRAEQGAGADNDAPSDPPEAS